jgi:hypothetical protein
MARLFGRKQARQAADAHERATTSEWLEAVITFTGDAGLIKPLRHAPAVPSTDASALVASGAV